MPSTRNIKLAVALALGAQLTAGIAQARPAVDPARADADFDTIMAPQSQLQAPVEAAPLRPWASGGAREDGTRIQLPLFEFEQLWAANERAADARSRDRQGPALVLGAARYEGEAVDGALRLDVSLSLTLSREGEWKTVPLVGEGAVLVEASVDGEPIGVTTRHGYHVWMTRRVGETVVKMKVLAPARGPRGSTEFDFAIPRTPSTAFSCRFPAAGLEPRVDSAVRAEVKSAEDATTLSAALRPTTRLHLVGFRDLGDDAAAAEARVYADSLSLLSVDDGALEVFTEVAYTILYAGVKRFELRIPEGMTVVSADGRGAFRYELVPDEAGAGALLRGETAYPIRDSYAISLRLRREATRGGERFAVPIPRSVGVEREVGWLAVEVPGKLRLEEAARGPAVTAIDTRQLPPELVRSAVSPILKAYRLGSTAGALELSVARLPEHDIASEAIDRVRAFTVVSPEGHALTELRMSLRNRIRASLTLSLPASANVRSALLDGAPVKPSRDEAGRLVLPLKRSEGPAAALGEIALSLVYDMAVDDFALLGQRDVSLPTFELPLSSLAWTLYLPGDNVYSALSGPAGEQVYWGQGHWTEASAADDAWGGEGHGDAAGRDEAQLALPTLGGVESAGAGAMPVRITLPTAGRRLEHERYWIGAGQPVFVGFDYARGWLPLAAALLLGLLLAAALGLTSRKAGRTPRWRVAVGGGVAAVAALGLMVVAHGAWLAAFGLLGLLVHGYRRRVVPRALRRLAEQLRTLPGRYRARERDLERRVDWPRVGRVALGVALAVVLLLLASDGLELVGRALAAL